MSEKSRSPGILPRFLVVITGAALALSLAGCGESGAESADSSPSVSQDQSNFTVTKHFTDDGHMITEVLDEWGQWVAETDSWCERRDLVEVTFGNSGMNRQRVAGHLACADGLLDAQDFTLPR